MGFTVLVKQVRCFIRVDTKTTVLNGKANHVGCRVRFYNAQNNVAGIGKFNGVIQ